VTTMKKFTRRQVLSQAGFGAAAVSMAGAVRLNTAQAAPAPAAGAIVGLGKFATQQLIPPFSECKLQDVRLMRLIYEAVRTGKTINV